MELSLVEIEPRVVPAPADLGSPPRVAEPAGGQPDGTDADRFLAEAAREHGRGQIDQPLWVRAVAQADGDEPRALEFYLRARATALRLRQRDRRSPGASRHAGPERRADPPTDQAAAPAPETPQPSLLSSVATVGRRLHPWQIAAVATLAVVLAIGWFALSGSRDDAPLAAGDSAARSASASTASEPRRDAPSGGIALDPAEHLRQLEGKVLELTQAGNWNVLVLHAADWARRDPDNPKAWKHLGVGYANLRQFEDAYNAAQTAARLAPTDSLLWKDLGQAAIASKRPEEALKAFEQASALDGQDVGSVILAGMMNAELGRFAQAKLAFDKALVASPGNPAALCGQTMIVRVQGKAKEPESYTRPRAALATECGDPGAASGRSADAGGSGAFKVAPARAR